MPCAAIDSAESAEVAGREVIVVSAHDDASPGVPSAKRGADRTEVACVEGDDHGVARGLAQAGGGGHAFGDQQRRLFVAGRRRQIAEPVAQSPHASALEEALHAARTDELQTLQRAGEVLHRYQQRTLVERRSPCAATPLRARYGCVSGAGRARAQMR